MTLSSYRTPREGRRVSMSFNLYRRLNRRILGTPRTFRYPFPSFTAVQSSQPNQERISALAKTAPAETNPPTPSPKPAKDLATSKAYAIINPSPATAKRPPNAPPKVVSHKLLNRAQDVQCYDAVPVSEPEETQAEVEKFIPMLEEYLKRTLEAASLIAHTINICYFFSLSHVHLVSDIQPTASGASSASDYVWDIFYHRTSKSTDWNKISQNIGTLCVLLRGSHWTVG